MYNVYSIYTFIKFKHGNRMWWYKRRWKRFVVDTYEIIKIKVILSDVKKPWGGGGGAPSVDLCLDRVY
jgi:hypothetical protein